MPALKLDRLYQFLSCVCLVLMTSKSLNAENGSWRLSQLPKSTSMRAIHVTDDGIVWVAGSEASVFRSDDQGNTFVDVSPVKSLLGSEESEVGFRSLHAWDSSNAVVATAGQPALVLRTKDGGESWSAVAELNDKAAFFDGMAFADEKRGFLFSDPINGKWKVLETEDKGRNWIEWEDENSVVARKDEAGFAASNSSILVHDGRLFIGTGGTEDEAARILEVPIVGVDANTRKWQTQLLPMPSSSTKGIFSLAANGKTIVAVGGDYTAKEPIEGTAAVSLDYGETWRVPSLSPTHFQSSVLVVASGSSGKQSFFLSTGVGRVFGSFDGEDWYPVSDNSSLSGSEFHALECDGEYIFATGANGVIGRTDINGIRRLLSAMHQH